MDTDTSEESTTEISEEDIITLPLNPSKHDSLRILVRNKRSVDAILAESESASTCTIQIDNFRYSIEESLESVKEKVYGGINDQAVSNALKKQHRDLKAIEEALGEESPE